MAADIENPIGLICALDANGHVIVCDGETNPVGVIINTQRVHDLGGVPTVLADDLVNVAFRGGALIQCTEALVPGDFFCSSATGQAIPESPGARIVGQVQSATTTTGFFPAHINISGATAVANA